MSNGTYAVLWTANSASASFGKCVLIRCSVRRRALAAFMLLDAQCFRRVLLITCGASVLFPDRSEVIKRSGLHTSCFVALSTYLPWHPSYLLSRQGAAQPAVSFFQMLHYEYTTALPKRSGWIKGLRAASMLQDCHEAVCIC